MIEDIGNRIQSLRLARGLSLSELALRAGVAKSYLSNVERNIQSNPSIQFLEKLADSLHVPLDLILYGDTAKADGQLDSDWHQLVKDAMASGISKSQFKEFLEFQKWKLTGDKQKE